MNTATKPARLYARHETLQEAGYAVVNHTRGRYTLQDIETGRLEQWVVNNGHASYGIRLSNGDDLEFVGSYPQA